MNPEGAWKMDEALEVFGEDAGGGLHRIRVKGTLELATAEVLRDFVAQTLKSGHVHLILNLDGVDYMDSSGLAVLLGTLRRVRERHGSMRLVCSVRHVLRLLSLTGIDRLLPIHADEAEALKEPPSP